MSELATRAKELAMDLEMVTYPHSEHVLDKLEQALLAERRLAMESAEKMVRDYSFPLGARHPGLFNRALHEIADQLRAAAEKEVGK